MADEILKRFGTDSESAEKLADAATAAEASSIAIHGVSVTARRTNAPAGQAERSEVEKHFRVHDTPSRRDPLHRTVELPNSVTAEVAELFNRLFGRRRPMNPGTNGVHSTKRDPNLFGTPSRMILLGYYDGPTEGVIQFGDGGPVYRFVMPDEELQLSRQWFPRDYHLHLMPVDALDRLEAALAEHLTPIRPVWDVNWQFESPEAERETDSRVSEILAEAGPAAWLVTVPAAWTFADFQPSRVVALQSA